MAIIDVQEVSKRYPARKGARALLGRGGVGDWLRGRAAGQVEVLRDITFSVEAGESVGIIGRNGSGKSTLLKMLAGVTLPSSGHVRVEGRVASLLELGAGFHPMLTGRENVYLNAGLLGMRHAQVDEVFEHIVAFSGIGDFIDQPVETYSSGMYVRIAFAVAVHTNPDIFLVDEVLAVGDEAFQRQCRRKIGELKDAGKTIIFVSHDLGIVNTLCDRVVLLENGRMVVRPTPRDTIDYYLRQVGEAKGIHTIAEDDTEAVFSHGRLALFQAQQEATAPAGIQLHFEHMGQYHNATQADWDVVRKEGKTFEARGAMARLPLEVHWNATLNDGELAVDVALDVQRPLRLDRVSLQFFWPQGYERWQFVARALEAPAIGPADQTWGTVAPPDAHARQVLALDENGAAPPLLFSWASDQKRMTLELNNTDYIMGARALELGLRHGAGEEPLAPGLHPLVTARVRLDLDEAAARRHCDTWLHACSRSAGTLRAVMGAGVVRLYDGEAGLSAGLHLHTQMRIGHLWVLSDTLQWTTAHEHDGAVVASGASSRFPLVQHWTLEPAEMGVRFRVEVEVTKPVEVQEYNVSLGLATDYTEWQTDIEQGAFPPIAPGQDAWIHFNERYEPASWGGVTGERIPGLRWSFGEGNPAMALSALNAGAHHNMRVLQAICSPGQVGVLHLAEGRHVWFDGVLSLNDSGR